MTQEQVTNHLQLIVKWKPEMKYTTYTQNNSMREKIKMNRNKMRKKREIWEKRQWNEEASRMDQNGLEKDDTNWLIQKSIFSECTTIM